MSGKANDPKAEHCYICGALTTRTSRVCLACQREDKEHAEDDARGER